MPDSFGDLLRKLLTRKGMSQMDLARDLGTTSSVISQTTTGSRLPPLDRIDLWADAMRLTEDEREEFALSAALAHCPEPIQREMARLQATITRLEKAVSALESERTNKPPKEKP